jgi:hypothetical protein
MVSLRIHKPTSFSQSWHNVPTSYSMLSWHLAHGLHEVYLPRWHCYVPELGPWQWYPYWQRCRHWSSLQLWRTCCSSLTHRGGACSTQAWQRPCMYMFFPDRTQHNTNFSPSFVRGKCSRQGPPWWSNCWDYQHPSLSIMWPSLASSSCGTPTD